MVANPPSLTWLAVVVVVSAGLCAGVADKTTEPAIVRTPDSYFSRLPELGYPWRPRYIHVLAPGLSTHPLRVHYIDEGPHNATETLLLLHGTPAWSFLYRSMIPVFLRAGYRVVALDQIGFGRSDKLTDPGAYSHRLHVATVIELVRHLDLQGITAVLHDLGGPTGVSAMRRDPGRYHRLVLLNTWLPQGDALARPLDHAAYLSWRGLVTLLGRRSPVNAVFKFASDASWTDIKWGYGAPFPSYIYQAGPSHWPRMIPLTPDDPVAREMQASAAFLQGWKGPALIGYSDRERFTIPGRPLLHHVLPAACRLEVPDAGHFLQEDQGPLLADIIIRFITHGCHLQLYPILD